MIRDRQEGQEGAGSGGVSGAKRLDHFDLTPCWILVKTPVLEPAVTVFEARVWPSSLAACASTPPSPLPDRGRGCGRGRDLPQRKVRRIQRGLRVGVFLSIHVRARRSELLRKCGF